MVFNATFSGFEPMTKGKRAKGETKIYKTLHIKLKIEKQEPH
jgi:hypothetical protein